MICRYPLLDRELDETAKVKNTDNKLVGKKRHHQVEVLHLFRWSTHTPRCREAGFLATAKLVAELLSGP